jgi:hypothetical protein
VKIITPEPPAPPAATEVEKQDASNNAGGGSVTSGSSAVDKNKAPKKKKKIKMNKPCRFGKKCRNSRCPFIHPGDISQDTPTEPDIQGSDSPIPAVGDSLPSNVLTVEEYEQGLIATVTDAPSAVNTFAQQQQQQHPVNSYPAQATANSRGAMDYDDDDGDYIEDLLRQQEMERLELAAAAAGAPSMGAAGSDNFSYHQQHGVNEHAYEAQRRQSQQESAAAQQQQQQQQMLSQASELEQARQKVAELEKQLELERQKRLKAEEMASREAQPLQQPTKPQKAAKPRKQKILQKEQMELRHHAEEQYIEEERLKQEAEARRRAEEQYIEEERLKQEAEARRRAREHQERLKQEAEARRRAEEHRLEEERLKQEACRRAEEHCLEEEHKQQEKADLEKALINERLEQQRLREQEEEDLRRAIEASLEEQEAHNASLEQYRAQRIAAKKEKRRLEREAKAAVASAEEGEDHPPKVAPKPNESVQKPFSTAHTAEPVLKKTIEKEDEKDKNDSSETQPKQTKESKNEKKRKKLEQRLVELEKEANERAKFWEPEIEKETDAIPKMVQLCIGEFCRTNSGFSRLEFSRNQDVIDRITPYCRDSFRKLFDAELHSNVVVKGMGKKQQDINDRNGVILWWDEPKSKFEVEIEGKKGNRFTLLIQPSNLEPAANQSSRKKRGKNGSRAGHGHTILIGDVCDGKGLLLDLDKELVDKLVADESTQVFVSKFVQQQDYLEALEKETERKRQEEEEEERRRRAERRRREQEEWENRQREYQEQKAEYKARKKAHSQQQHRSQTFSGFEQRCNCPDCQFRGGFEEFFFRSFFGMGMGMGGAHFSFRFADDDDDDDDDDDEWDRRWQEMHEEDLEEQLEAAAEELGVDVDASASDIKRVYRRKALLYHPDKARARETEGLTADECEEKFKHLQNAHDLLMSQFD